jgi:uncharacterized protein (TIGR02246 family)
MSQPPSSTPLDAPSPEWAELPAIRALYERMLLAWNSRDADAFAAQFTTKGHSIGFDGSELRGRAQIASTLRGIFADHPTGRYVWKVRWVRPLAPGVALLRADVGMVPAGQTDIAPALNTVQTVVAAQSDGEWCIIQLQNTPAQLHGRPDLVQQMTDELRQLL